MAIALRTDNPESIVDDIRALIDAGEIISWGYDADGDFTHSGQWKNKAWISTIINGEELTFYIVGRKSVQMELSECAVFHGLFVELLLTSFSDRIMTFEVTAPYVNDLDCNNIHV